MGINFLAILRDQGDIRELRVLAQFAECRSDFSLKLIQFQKHFLLHFFFGADFLLSAIFSKEYCTAITRSSTQSSSRSSSLRTNRCATIPGFATSSFWHHWLPQFFCSQCQGIVRGQNLNWTRTDIKKHTNKPTSPRFCQQCSNVLLSTRCSLHGCAFDFQFILMPH